MEIKILLICGKNSFCDYAIKILQSYFNKDQYVVISGNSGTKLDDELHWYKPEYVLSFLSPWTIPKSLILSAKNAAINFHPGSPRYPGVACYNFALYEKAMQYGVTCHHLEATVTDASIISASYFEIAPNETLKTLEIKSMFHILNCFEQIISIINKGGILPESSEKWLHEPYTKELLEDLCKINASTMDMHEISLRIRATDKCDLCSGAYIELGDSKFIFHYNYKKEGKL